jgi:hypothetical protein
VSNAGLLAELFAELKSCKCLFLGELNEPNRLRLVVEQGKGSPESTPLNMGARVISGGSSVLYGPHTSRFEIVWDHCIAYSVLNQMDSVGDESEKSELGNLARVDIVSKFLHEVRHATFTHEKAPGLSEPIPIICQGHVIDVIATTVPTVEKLRSTLRD